jgi:SAM-dependent methyltransferase
MNTKTDLTIPSQALHYILYQRTKYQTFGNLRIVRALRKLRLAPLHSTLNKWDARFRADHIRSRCVEDMQQEYALLRQALPPAPQNILDIGCGIACIDVYLFRHYGESKALNFYLLDRTELSERVAYGFFARNEFYNSLAMAKTTLEANGIASDRITLLEARDDFSIALDIQLDLVISLISWGYHYPVSTYLPAVYRLMREGASLILDVRRDSGGADDLRKTFRNVTPVANPPWCDRFLCVK